MSRSTHCIRTKRPTPLARSISLPAFLAALLLPTFALADTFTVADPAGALRLDVYTWDAHACVITPGTPPTGACTPADPTTLPAPPTPKAELLSSAVIHFDGWDMGARAVRLDASTATFDGIETETALKVARQAVRGLLGPDDTLLSDGIDEHTEVQRRSNVPLVRATPTIERAHASGEREKLALVEYVVCAQRGVYDIAFVAGAAHTADVAKVADNALATLVAAPPVLRNSNVFNSAAFRFGRVTLFVLVGVLVRWGFRALRGGQRTRPS